ncbi:TauD/TfdA family dioxygenase [Streptomyces sp. NPDC001852]|uniref:TauD/TfdA family dioxygenase n=1 Tax=Streptomyces sp. NPDC001852 TaxID=3364619 RepID=UPI0036B2F39D
MADRFTISPAAGAALRERAVAPDTALDAWPADPPGAAGPEVAALAAGIIEALREGPGYAVVETGVDGLADHDLCTLYWNLFTSVFRPTPQYRTGELIYPVEVSPGLPAVSHYSGSNQAGGYHTDGTLLPEPPEVACLFGLSAAEGGETLIMDGNELAAQLDALDPAHLRALTEPVHFDVNGQIDGLVTKRQPVFRAAADGNGFELRYLRMYIEQGYDRAGEPLPVGLTAAMDAFDKISSLPENQTPVLLRRGVALLWNNRRMLHGRRPFHEQASSRRLRRLYGAYDPARRPGHGDGSR